MNAASIGAVVMVWSLDFDNPNLARCQVSSAQPFTVRVEGPERTLEKIESQPDADGEYIVLLSGLAKQDTVFIASAQLRLMTSGLPAVRAGLQVVDDEEGQP